MRQVDVGTLHLTAKHRAKVMEALKSNRLSYGPMTDEFEKKFAKIHHNKFGIFTNSGTAALTATLHAMKILYGWKDGDEIIIPATTFVATYNVVLHNNLKPVLVDISWDLNINVDDIESAITTKTRAIMPVHLLGRPANMEAIIPIAQSYSLKVIEDSCETMFMKNVGMGDVTCFSFYVAHLLVTGVGGMAITNDEELAKLIRSLIFHGRDNRYLKLEDDDIPTQEIIDARFRFLYPGYSARATEVEAALGLVELENYKQMIAKRRTNAKFLGDYFYRDNPTWWRDYYKNHAFMMFPVICGDERNDLMLYLEKHGITTRTLMPLLNQPYIQAKGNFERANHMLDYGMLIGCHQGLTINDIKYVIDTVKDFYD